MFCGSLLTQSILIANTELVAAADNIELNGLPNESAKIVGKIMSVIFCGFLSAGVLLIIDAVQHPSRGLGRYWPKVAHLVYLFQLFVERRCREREQIRGEWPDVIGVDSDR